jgi:hypothetical protein
MALVLGKFMGFFMRSYSKYFWAKITKSDKDFLEGHFLMYFFDKDNENAVDLSHVKTYTFYVIT